MITRNWWTAWAILIGVFKKAFRKMFHLIRNSGGCQWGLKEQDTQILKLKFCNCLKLVGFPGLCQQNLLHLGVPKKVLSEQTLTKLNLMEIGGGFLGSLKLEFCLWSVGCKANFNSTAGPISNFFTNEERRTEFNSRALEWTKISLSQKENYFPLFNFFKSLF